ncbi:TonB-dependent siderophore receptor [Uliginosibacterium sp. H1]|uniref:TonB-dependent siderophore receptor n=1 Tax=Uliginosibacterium sp. H1 TaxID=3114757 RepID=UPI002E17B397|nr:TonB-dependent siderophore receptor [Uliginosibacterium sp. H1]
MKSLQRRTPFRPRASRLALAIALAITTPHWAMAQSAAAPVRIDIPAQGLGSALNELARQTGQQLIVAPELVANRQAPAVSGSLTPDQALQRLLSGSGLEAVSQGNTLVIRPGRGETMLPAVTVTASGEDPNGPVGGYAATRTMTGTKTDTPLRLVPQSVSVVSAEQIADQDAQSVAQALRYSAGVFTEYRGASNLHDEMFMRGFYYVPRYYNGLRYGSGSSGQIDPYLLERVEVLHGPSSVLYGQANPGGVVNLVGKQAGFTPHNEVTLGTGNYDRIALGADVGFVGSESLAYRVVFNGEKSNTQEDGLEQERYSLAPSLTWKPNAATQFDLYALFQHEPQAGYRNFMEKLGTVDPTVYGYIPSDFLVSDPNYEISDRDQLALGYRLRHDFDDSLSFRQNLRFSSIDFEHRTLVWNALQSNQRTITRQGSGGSENLNQFLVDNQLQFKTATGAVRHTLLGGLDYTYSQRDYQWGRATAPSIDWLAPVYNVSNVNLTPSDDSDTTAWQTGLYAQDQMAIGRLNLLLGGRYDWTSTTIDDKLARSNTTYDDGAFTGRAGVVYAFDNGLSPYASYSTSFEPVLQSAPSGQPAFDPTTAQQVEVGVKFAPPGARYNLTAAVYELVQQNVLSYDFSTQRNYQTGEIRSKGFELEGQAEITREFSILGSYTYIDSRVTESKDVSTIDKLQARTPMNQAALWGRYAFGDTGLKGLGIGLGVRYIGESQGDGANTFKVDAATLYDLMLSYDFRYLSPRLTGVSTQLNVSNLTDERYVASCASRWACFYGSGRVVTANLKYSW